MGWQGGVVTSDTPGRLLRLLGLLQARREWSGTELAERLGVTDRTVRRDVGRLRDLGYPVTGTTGTAGGYRLRSGRDLPPLLLDDEEAVAVAAALLTAGNVTGIEETASRALAKLERVLPVRLRPRVTALSAATQPLPGPVTPASAGAGSVIATAPDATGVHTAPRPGAGGALPVRPDERPPTVTSARGPGAAHEPPDPWAEEPAAGTGGAGRVGPRVAPGVLAVLAAARRDRAVAAFGYRDRSGRGSERRVEPHGLVVAEGRWCLVAYDLGREAWRTFRLERMSAVTATGRRFDPRPLPAPDAATFVMRALASAPYRYRARAVVPADAATVAARLPGPLPGTIEALDDGTCVVRLRADDADLICAHLVALGAAATITANEGLRDQLRHLADRLRTTGAG